MAQPETRVAGVQASHGAALPPATPAAPAATAFTVAASLGAPPQRVYSHLSDPHNLLGLQSLLISVEDVKTCKAAAAAGAPAAAGSAAEVEGGTAGAEQAGPDEVEFVAVEAFHFWQGGPAWHNRIRVRQQLLGRQLAQAAGDRRAQQAAACQPQEAAGSQPEHAWQGHADSETQPEQAAADGRAQQAAGSHPEHAGQAQADPDFEAQPLRMRFLVTSPPLGLVRLEVLWTFRSACQAAAAAVSTPEQQQQQQQQAEDGSVPLTLGSPHTPSSTGDECRNFESSRGGDTGNADSRSGGEEGIAASSSGGGGTRVQLDVSVQAPWLLRGFVVSQARQAQQALLANLKQRLEGGGGGGT